MTTASHQTVSATVKSVNSSTNANSTNKRWNYASDGKNYGKVLYHEEEGPSANVRSGVTVCKVEAGVTKVGGNYSNLSWNFGVATAEARAGVEYNNIKSTSIDKRGNTQSTKGFALSYVGFNADASLIRADATVKVPIPFTEKSLSIGVNGKAFSVGATCQLDLARKHGNQVSAHGLGKSPKQVVEMSRRGVTTERQRKMRTKTHSQNSTNFGCTNVLFPCSETELCAQYTHNHR